MKKVVYLLIVGRTESGPNPGLTKYGQFQMKLARLTDVLPDLPTRVISGTGKRHLESTKLAGLPEPIQDSVCDFNSNDHTINAANYIYGLPNNTVIVTDELFLENLDKKFYSDMIGRQSSLQGAVIKITDRRFGLSRFPNFALGVIDFKKILSPILEA